jgi:membrane associated rhomboid family serine protease
LATSNPLDLASTSASGAQPQLEPAPPDPRGFRSLSNTQILIATNVLIFSAMLFHSIWLSGVQWFIDTPIGADFDDKLLLLWGSDYGPLTLGGQYWRVLTCLFVHFNIFHLAGNMLFLWRMGKQLDRHLSRTQTLVIYLFTGAAASLASLAWHPTHLTAGSSGAILGQAGVLIALLSLARLNLPRRQTFGILLWIVLLMPFELLFGHFSKTTDYAAHAGGLASGLAIGVLLVWVLRGSPLERAARQRRVLAVTAFILVLSFGGVIAMRYRVVRQYRLALEVKSFLIAAQKEAISKNPNDLNAHQVLATLYSSQTEYDEAANELRRALEIKPGDPDTLFQVAITYMAMGSARDAIPIFQKNLSQGPATAGKYMSFSEVLEQAGNLSEAEEMARKAVALDNRSKRSHQQLASVLSQLHKTEEAEREYKLADQLPESPSYFPAQKLEKGGHP